MVDKHRDTAYQVIVRIPQDLSDRLETLTKQYMQRSVLGVKIGKATTAREAIILGLPLLEAKFKKEATDE